MKSPVSVKQVILINLLTLVVLASAFMVYRVVALPDNSLKSALSSPEVLSYQGTLMDTEGSPISGTKDIIFRVYNSPTDLTALWEESHTGTNAVEVQSGLFDVLLGSLVPIPESVWNETELYLGIQIGTDQEMAPREIINLMPLQIAPNSLDADVLLNGSISSQKLGEDIKIPVIQSGWVTRGYTSPGWNLREGDGIREFIVHITFSKPFTEIPDVTASLMMVDISKEFNTRIWVLAQNVSTTGFDLVIRTWSDTMVNSVGVTWVAIQD